MKISVILKNPSYFDDGVLVYENVKGYMVNTEKRFLVLDFEDKEIICINLDEILYFKIRNVERDKK